MAYIFVRPRFKTAEAEFHPLYNFFGHARVDDNPELLKIEVEGRKNLATLTELMENLIRQGAFPLNIQLGYEGIFEYLYVGGSIRNSVTCEIPNNAKQFEAVIWQSKR